MIRDTSEQDIVIPQDRRKWIANPRVWVLLAVVTASVVFAYPSVRRWQGASISVSMDRLRLATVKRSDLVRDIAVRGKIVAAVKPMLYSTAPGRVTLKVRAGDSVNEGDLIARIHSPGLTSQHKRELSILESLTSEVQRQELQTRTERLALKRQLDMAEVALIAARREMRRAEIAYKASAISLQDYEKAQDDLHRADLEFGHQKEENLLLSERLDLELKIQSHEQTRQQLLVDELSRKVRELSVVSPVTGVVGNIEVNEKDMVGEYQPILSVVDLSAYEVEIEVPESFADDLSLGVEVEIKQGERRFLGNLASISPEVESGQVKCQVRFGESKPVGLRQNQRVAARILLETKNNVLIVSRGSFLQIGGGRIAYVVNDGMASKRKIQTGATSISQVEILSGLQEGEIIVLSGANAFEDRDQVLLIE